MLLSGKRAIVTGGAVRIGRALALALAGRGMDVCLHFGNSTEQARSTAEEIRGLGVRCEIVQANLRDSVAAARTIVGHAVAALGGCDVLVNSAAIFEPSSLDDLTTTSLEETLSINLKSPLFLCQEFARRLPSDRRGHIVNLADWRATSPQPGHLAYTLAKAGLVALTRILAQELAPRIQVNAIAPGAILPPPEHGAEYLQRIARRIPLKRPGNPEELVRAMLYLLESDFVTGDVLYVTGGEELPAAVE